MPSFQELITTLQQSIFTWDYFCDFEKIKTNTFEVKIQLNILDSLLGENDIENKFIQLVSEYPETRNVLPILIAKRKKDLKDFPIITDTFSLEYESKYYLFDSKVSLDNNVKDELLIFFNESGLRYVFENKDISSLKDYVFGVETWLDTNARKNRTWTLMEDIVEDFLSKYCEQNPEFTYKAQASSSYIKEHWWVELLSDKANRMYDFWIFNKNTKQLFLVETNYYWGWGSKLKAVAGEFSTLYQFLQNQWFPLIWITDGLGWNTAKKPLEEAYNATNGGIYNLKMLKKWILNTILK